ncbi:hypothetical protein [Paenirhodobacter populi]|uniref:Pilus assembly protein n=1 Tax=Paenirhodobacter populi TaxID=2306993 RepID=A0A443JAN9_9RHOB|nr:hypothetical protein [Sinirhodobacter populi]RWR17576.1 hypothetical protein D2T30_18615 [Sinirhodobacter populi]
MKFFRIANRLRNLRRAEDGAVTVDWVVLTAAVVGLGAAALILIRGQTMKASETIGGYLEKVKVDESTTTTD